MSFFNNYLSIEHLFIFVKIVETSSFNEAAKAIGVPKSTVSRKMSKLEDNMGVKVFVRSPLGIRVTDIGYILYDHAVKILLQHIELENEICFTKDNITGNLKIIISAELKYSIFFEKLIKFCELYNELDIYIEITDKQIDFAKHEVDFYICSGFQENSNLISRKIGDYRLGIYSDSSVSKTEEIDILSMKYDRNKFPDISIILDEMDVKYISNDYDTLISSTFCKARNLILPRNDFFGRNRIELKSKLDDLLIPTYILFSDRKYIDSKKNEFLNFFSHAN